MLRKRLVIIGVCALFATAAGIAVADDSNQGPPPSWPTAEGPLALLSPNGDTYLVDTDNEDNAGSGSPDHDMGSLQSPSCIYNDDPKHPIEFNINVSGALPTTSAALLIEAWDVDESSGEVDEVYFNGTLVGTLTGADNQFSTTVLTIPLADVVAGDNLVQVQVDVNNVHDWCVGIPRAQLIIDGGAAATVACRYIETDKAIYDFGETVEVTVEVDEVVAVARAASPTAEDIRLEVNILNPSAVNVDGDDLEYAVDGTADDPKVFNLSLPGSGDTGTYVVEALIFNSRGVFQTSCSTTIQVGYQATPVPNIPTTSGSGLMVFMIMLAAAGILVLWRLRS
jgi:hypothetical protein